MDSIVNYLDKYSDLIFEFQIGFLVIILSVFVWVWYYNRKKYNHLKHQIPASVVKSYLDSIIQNSTALKSSLFRGGGLDVDPSSVPSVMPLQDLPGSTSINIDGGGDDALRAQIAGLQAQLAQKTSIVTDLETKNAELEGIVKQKQERIEELEKLLAEALANAGSGEGGADPAALIAMTKERDELKEELQQYDIISNDIADMKRLKQENDQLKKALADAGGEAPAAPPEVSAPPVVDAAPAEAVEASAPPVEDVAIEEPAAEVPSEPVAAAAPEGEDKSPEDLLSEFEKMLG